MRHMYPHTLRRTLKTVAAVWPHVHGPDRGDIIVATVSATARTRQAKTGALARLADAVDRHYSPRPVTGEVKLEDIETDPEACRAHIRGWRKHHDPNLARVPSHFRLAMVGEEERNRIIEDLARERTG